MRWLLQRRNVRTMILHPLRDGHRGATARGVHARFSRPNGWQKDDTDQLSIIVNHTLGMRIAVANTDDATGLISDDAVPQNGSNKGAATDRVVDSNQHSLFRLIDADTKVVPFRPRERHSGSYATFYLCVFNEGDEVRAEFSCPS